MRVVHVLGSTRRTGNRLNFERDDGRRSSGPVPAIVETHVPQALHTVKEDRRGCGAN
jgi:hypothetical protein